MKSAKWFFVTIALVFGLFVVVAGLSGLLSAGIDDASIVHIRLDGEIAEADRGPDLGGLFDNEGPLSLHHLTGAIRRAARDERVVGLLLEVKRPAVGVAQIEEIEAAIATFRDAGKWTAAFLETAGEGTSGDGAYALAACADHILLSPPGDVTLIGLAAQVPFFKGALDRLELDTYVEKRHEFKNAANMFTETEFTPAHREAIGVLLDDVQRELVRHIGARRKQDEDTVKQWIAAGPHMASEALDKGIVDELAYWDGALDAAKKVAGRDEPLVTARQYHEVQMPATGEHEVALIVGEGDIVSGSGPSPFEDPKIASDPMTKAFRAARKDEVEGVIFRINSPGGGYVASDVIRREVELTRLAGIPVVASMGNVAASGGYIVALEASAVLAQPSTITGSIGVFTGMLASRRAWEHWLGVTFDSYKTAPMADMFSGLDLPSPAARARLKTVVDRIYDEFIAKAAKARHKTAEEIHAVAKGRVWSGRRALELGLVDGIGGLWTAVDKLRELRGWDKEETVSLRPYPEPLGFFESLSQGFATRADLPEELRAALAMWRRLSEPPEGRLLRAPYIPQLP